MTDKKKNGWIKFVPSLDLPKERVSIAYDTHDERGVRYAYGYFQFYNGTCGCFWKDGNEQPKVVKAEDIKYWMPVPSLDVQEEPISIWHDASKETPTQGSNILMIRKEEKDTNYPPIAGCFHGKSYPYDKLHWYKAKLKKIKSLADKMYNAAFNMTTDASLLRKAMDDYHQFIIYEYYKKEPASEKKCMFTKDGYTDEDRMVLCEDCKEKCEYSKKGEPVSDDEIEKQFKVGDIVVYMSRHPAYSGLYLLGNPNDLSIGYSNANEPYQIALRNCTIASEDERRQFMRELNDNGYKWNEVTLRIDKKEKPVSENLEKAAVEAFKEIVDDERNSFLEIFKAGAEWKKAHNWKPADGDDLPEYEREVIVLIKYNTQRNIHDEEYPTYRVGFGHRPNPNGWDGKNIDTNEVTHYTPELYDKGGWNAPNIVYWLDYDINELLCR